ncbi:MAG TPA: hypothetical protein VFC82_09410 [Actinomycetaceae bacterium]|nr:hypothetical protein [Actinomycetaceae bacterium]
MTDSRLETEEFPAPQDWLEEVCDALGLTRRKLEAVKPAISEIVSKLEDSPVSDETAITAFIIGFTAAKDGDFSPESVSARAAIVERHLEYRK